MTTGTPERRRRPWTLRMFARLNQLYSVDMLDQAMLDSAEDADERFELEAARTAQPTARINLASAGSTTTSVDITDSDGNAIGTLTIALGWTPLDGAATRNGERRGDDAPPQRTERRGDDRRPRHRHRGPHPTRALAGGTLADRGSRAPQAVRR